MFADLLIPTLQTDMITKHLGGQIWYRSLDPVKKTGPKNNLKIIFCYPCLLGKIKSTESFHTFLSVSVYTVISKKKTKKRNEIISDSFLAIISLFIYIQATKCTVYLQRWHAERATQYIAITAVINIYSY